MTDSLWSPGLIAAIVIAAFGFVIAILDPSHWYAMVPMFIGAAGVYLLATASQRPLSPTEPASGRAQPFFGAPSSVFTAGWGTILLVTGALLLVATYVSGLGFYLLYVWIAVTVIVVFFGAQSGRARNHG